MKSFFRVSIISLCLSIFFNCATQGYFKPSSIIEENYEKVGVVTLSKSFWHILFIGKSPSAKRKELLSLATKKAEGLYGEDIRLENISFDSEWSPASLLLYLDMLGFVEKASIKAEVFIDKNSIDDNELVSEAEKPTVTLSGNTIYKQNLNRREKAPMLVYDSQYEAESKWYKEAVSSIYSTIDDYGKLTYYITSREQFDSFTERYRVSREFSILNYNKVYNNDSMLGIYKIIIDFPFLKDKENKTYGYVFLISSVTWSFFYDTCYLKINDKIIPLEGETESISGDELTTVFSGIGFDQSLFDNLTENDTVILRLSIKHSDIDIPLPPNYLKLVNYLK